ncbi:hypothetical protein D9M71_571730 [compost metagenome]
MKVRVPTKGSVAILKARAENGSLSSAWRSSSFSGWSGWVPRMDGISVGAGSSSTTESSTSGTPLFLKEEPHTAGTTSQDRVRMRRPVLISSSERSPSSRYLVISSSLASAATSSITLRQCRAWSSSSAGMSSSRGVAP